MRNCRSTIICTLLAMFIAEGSVYAQEMMVYLKDGQIVRERKANSSINENSSPQGNEGYQLKKGKIAIDVDPVQEALKVYKKKGGNLYQKKIWILNKENGKQDLLVEFTSSNFDNRLLFSPNEDFMYFLKTGIDGQNIIYGLELDTKRQFIVGAGKNFDMIACPNQTSYVIIEQDELGLKHFIYQITGQQKKVLNGAMTPDEIKKQVCY